MGFFYAGVACVGHAQGNLEPGDTKEHILEALRTRFCGCTHVFGNVRISMAGLYSVTLSEDDFNFLYHLEQVSGAIYLDNIPRVDHRIILPNLRLIRGNELEGGRYAIVLRNVSVDEVILPKLIEISQGSVLVEQSNNVGLCNLLRVNWLDILDDGNFEDDSCTNPPLSGNYVTLSKGLL